MTDDHVICYCKNITVGDIKTAIKEGATTLEAIEEATGAGTICGQCNEEIEELLAE